MAAKKVEEILESAGIHVLKIPTPFAVGRVNVYLLDDDPLTIIDTGPNSGKSLDELETQLASHGRSIEDIELLLLTHQHLDHIGLADIIAKRSGAKVGGTKKMAKLLLNYTDDSEADDKYAVDLMLRHGIPEDVVRALAMVSRSFRGWGSNVELTKPLEDREEIVLKDRTLEVILRPGHSPSCTIYWDAKNKVIFGGDHLIDHISSNPLLHRPLDYDDDDDLREGKRPQALVTYLESIKKTAELPAEVVFSGHGDAITDHRELINKRLDLHTRRAEKIYKLIVDRPSSAYEVAQELWGNVAVTQAFLTLSEVVGHVDILLNENRVAETEVDGVTIFEAVR